MNIRLIILSVLLFFKCKDTDLIIENIDFSDSALEICLPNISNKLLPHVPLCPVQRKIVGVNSPAELCMEHKKCEYLFASGKQKGKACYRGAFEGKYGIFCNRMGDIMGNS